MCRGYTTFYIGKTYRNFKVRVSKHQCFSPRTGKPVKGTLSISVRGHMLICDHKVVQENLKFVSNESNRHLLESKESLFIKRDKRSLKKTYTRSYYRLEYYIKDKSFLFNFATDIILITTIRETWKYFTIIYISQNFVVKTCPPEACFG